MARRATTSPCSRCGRCPMPDERAARLATNEARFREINERVERDLEPLTDSPEELLTFVCECGRRNCTDAIALSIAEYESARRDATRFVVVSGHEIEDVEDVIERTDRYAIVRKHPPTRKIAEQTDPRR
jgi:mannose-1-phosphate guanylyltransferase